LSLENYPNYEDVSKLIGIRRCLFTITFKWTK